MSSITEEGSPWAQKSFKLLLLIKPLTKTLISKEVSGPTVLWWGHLQGILEGVKFKKGPREGQYWATVYSGMDQELLMWETSAQGTSYTWFCQGEQSSRVWGASEEHQVQRRLSPLGRDGPWVYQMDHLQVGIKFSWPLYWLLLFSWLLALELTMVLAGICFFLSPCYSEWSWTTGKTLWEL